MSFNSTNRNLKTRKLTLENLETRRVMAPLADLIAYRPVTDGINYAQFTVPDAQEVNLTVGPGIRINGDDDNANGIADRNDNWTNSQGDNDLVRVDVTTNTGSGTLDWSSNLNVWSNPWKNQALARGQSVTSGQQVWVEYVGISHNVGANTFLRLRASDSVSASTDTIQFHTFRSEIVVIGGNLQDPNTQFNTSVFAIGTDLYKRGYDVHMFAHTSVNTNGSGAAFNEVSNAILNRGVASVAMFGYSWGGGAVRDLSNALATDAGTRGRFTLQYTAAIDGIQHYTPFAETRLPTNTSYHHNIFQRNDFFLRGNTVTGANNINTSTTGPNRTLNHSSIDDSAFVFTTISNNLRARVQV